MINPEAQSKGNTVVSLARLYPETFVMAAAVNSRSGLAVRRLEIACLISPGTCVGQSSENTLQQSTGGLLVVNPMKV